MQVLTESGRQAVAEAGARHGFSPDVAAAVTLALVGSGGSMAQFNHPELGGMGQWSRGGMIMVGDMFNNGLKARVDGLCNDLSALLATDPNLFRSAPSSGLAPGGSFQSQYQTGGSAGFSGSTLGAGVMNSGQWWPTDFGAPSTSGSQNDMHYAYFPESRRLVVEFRGTRTVYDTGEHRIGGVSQQQGGGQTLAFQSQFGTVPLSSLPVIEGGATPPAAPLSNVSDSLPGNDPIAMLERLAALRDQGILSEEEFAAKKRDLLARL